MIRDLQLTAAQLAGLARAIVDLFAVEGYAVSGLEVTHVQDEVDCMKARVVFDNPDGEERRDSIYFHAAIGEDSVTDFREVRHG